MRTARLLLLCLALLGCGKPRGEGPDWIASAPPDAVAAISCRTDWAQDPTRMAALLQRYPPAGVALSLVLQRVQPELLRQAGRITLYLARRAGRPAAAGPSPRTLLQLGGFRLPGRIQTAIAQAFPETGIRTLDNRDLPSYVVLDLPSGQIRAMADPEGRIWLGDPADLAGIGTAPAGSGAASREPIPDLAPAPLQGFIRPGTPDPRLPGDQSGTLPAGTTALAWAVTPAQDPSSPVGFELALAGPDRSMDAAAAWLQRFADAVQSVPGQIPQVPEIQQVETRIGLKCQLNRVQLALAMERLGLPPVPGP
jgi:hypothetical protein